MAALLLGGAQLLLVLQSAAVLQGTVREAESERPLALVLVELPQLGRRAISDSAGRYRIDQLPDGAHQITAHLLGYRRHGFVALLPPGAALQIDIVLSAQPVELPEIVSRGAVPGGAGAAFEGFRPSTQISAERLTTHPLLPEPDGLLAFGGGTVAVQPESPSGLQVLGGAADQTAYLLDGMPVFSPYHSGGIFGAWNADALAQLSLASTAPPLAAPGSLGGAITAETRTPGAEVRGRGALSTSQARVTVDGPLGIGSAGFLLSLRRGFSDLRAPKAEPDYLRGGTSDWVAKLQAPLLGGAARLLGYGNHNGFSAATLMSGPGLSVADDSRNRFGWNATSFGAGWTRPIPGGEMRVIGWRASSSAGATWLLGDSGATLRAGREDWGLSASFVGRNAAGATEVGLRVEQSRTRYRLAHDSGGQSDLDLRASTPLVTGFVEQARPLGSGVGLTLGASVTAGGGGLRLGPRAEARWRPGPRVTVSGSYARTHQFAQSLRNPESVVGHVFPVDLYLGAGSGAMPVARSDVLGLAIHYRPGADLRLGLQGFLRHSRGLALVAPRSGEPFATDSWEIGAGRVHGVALESELTRPRFWLIARYRWQHSRLYAPSLEYVPAGAADHSVDAGITVFPARTTSVRLGGTAMLGRRATAVANGLEWEACNLRDRGCEFGGTPTHEGEVLGGTTLPAYLRVDLSVRQQWAFTAAGRRTTMALFGTFSNLLGRENLLTYARNPVTGARTRITMRPPAPLVAGLEWQF